MKRIQTKRIKRFKELFSDFKETENGFYVFIPENSKVTQKFFKRPGNTSKSEIHKFLSFTEVEGETGQRLYLPKNRNKMMLYCDKLSSGLTFEITRHNLQNKIADNLKKKFHLTELFYTGMKCEYIKDYPYLTNMKVAEQCSSFEEFRLFCKFDFISDSEFDWFISREVRLHNTHLMQNFLLLLLRYNIDTKVIWENRDRLNGLFVQVSQWLNGENPKVKEILIDFTRNNEIVLINV